MSWSRGGTEGFLKPQQRTSSFHFVGSEEKWALQREIRLFRSWNTLPRARNLKPKFEFQTPLAQNSPAGSSELIPFGANSNLPWNCHSGTLELPSFGANLDLPWDWIFSDILLRDSSLLSPVGVYYASTFVGLHISPSGFHCAYPFLGNYMYIVIWNQSIIHPVSALKILKIWITSHQ